MIEGLEAVGLFLAEHPDLVSLIIDVLKGGTPKEALMDAIKAAQVEASKAKVRAELGV